LLLLLLLFISLLTQSETFWIHPRKKPMIEDKGVIFQTGG